MAMERRKDAKNRVLKEGEYQRANGSFEYRWRDKSGKRHSKYAKSLDELRKFEKEIQKVLFDGIKIDEKVNTINDLYYLWVKVKRGLKLNTFQNYKYMYSQFIEPDFGKIKFADLKRSDVRNFYNYLVDTRNLKISTVDTINNVLHQVLELGVEDDYLRYNPSDNALKELKKARNLETEKRKSLTVDEQNIFEAYLEKNGKNHRWYPIFVIMMWTGMRVGEITGLRWCDIDLDEGIININHTLVYFNKGDHKCSFAINSPKTKAGERLIPMLPIVKKAFLMEREYQKECNLECTAVVDGYTDFIFINRFGGVQHQGTLNKALRRIIRDCNFDIIDKNKSKKEALLLPKFSNHILRHTFTTRMCEAGVNIKVIQEILGHADVETTLQIYADATKDFKKSEMSIFEEFFNANKGNGSDTLSDDVNMTIDK